MTEIELTGEIGWDITSASFRRDLSAASGDVRLRIHSPGGAVMDGIDIANAIRAYRREGNRVSAYISGMCASMATYIASICDEVEAEDNAVYMIHNPWMFALGDYRDMDKAGEILLGLARVLAMAYAARTERQVDVIRSEMDAETWLFGAEIIDAGYADRVVPAGEGAEERAGAVAIARARMQALQAKMKEHDQSTDFDRIAAMLPLNPPEAAMAENTPAAGTPEPQVPETPQIDAADIVATERARVAAIMERCASVNMPDLAQSAIVDGLSIDALNARIVDAYATSGGPEIRSATANGPAPIDAAAIEQRIFNQVAVGGIR